MTVDVFPVPVAGVRRRVPSRYELARYPGGTLTAIDVWVVDCRGLAVGGRPHAPGALAMIGAVLAGRSSSSQAISPRNYEHYLLSAQTNRAELTALLQRSGVPAETVRRLQTSHTVRHRITAVRSPSVSYVLSAPLSRRRDKPHDHFNAWWHDDRAGSAAALELRVKGAQDLYCPARLCGRITATGAGVLADVLDARSRRARVSLRHVRLDPMLTVVRPDVAASGGAGA
jgi:hypothetical protein